MGVGHGVLAADQRQRAPIPRLGASHPVHRHGQLQGEQRSVVHELRLGLRCDCAPRRQRVQRGRAGLRNIRQQKQRRVLSIQWLRDALEPQRLRRRAAACGSRARS
eukprot:Amastigsp_a844132_6.p5 type:complete len:106 gc:universal Amastigsp_a844132_6:673-990(+)